MPDLNQAREKSMPPTLKRFALFVICFAACLPAAAQNPLDQILPPTTAPTSKSANARTDPFGRETPAGCVFGFLQAAQAGNYSIAAQYLQLSAARRQSEGEQLASKLKFVMDRAFAGSLKNVSTQPEGVPQEGVPSDRQKLGTMSSRDAEAELQLVRVSDPSAGKIWLISSDTLAKVPEIYEQVQARQVESRLPNVLVKHQIAGMTLWQWLGLLLAIPLAAALGWAILALLEIPIRWWARRRGRPDVASWPSVSGPAWLVAGTFAHQFLASYLRMPLLQRHYYFQITAVALVIGANWILWRVIQWTLRRMRLRALARGHGSTGSLMLLGERVVKAAVIVMAVLLVFGTLGFNMSTALAGLGIGGLAIGFGAQKTIENLFGGVSVLGDEVIRVGDVCTFGDRTGVVEDIGLRSTRVRTEERTLLAIPNGTVATINVENLSRRDKILFKTKLGVRPETTPDHLRFVLAELRRLLYSHPKIETKTVRVRLIDISTGALNVEILSYVLTQDFNEFAAVREDLLLRMMDLVIESGTTFALPSQTLYLGRDSGIKKEKADTAVKKIAELRNGKQLPFPDFPEEDISSLRGSIDYPQPESALRNKQPNSRP
jgi:MscS family membrane protein